MASLIALDLANSPAFVDALCEVWDAGNAVLPIDSRLPHAAKEALLAELRPHEIWTAHERSRRTDPMAARDGDAIVVATSGTTGTAKGVVLTHTAIGHSSRITNDALAVDSARDRWYACLPFAHIGGLSVLTRALHSGVAVTASAAIDSASLAAALETGHTLVSLVVAALGRTDIARWRTVVVGGSSMPNELPANVVRTYGMTETASGVVYDGTPLQGVAMTVREADSQILLRTPTLARCYRTRFGDVDLAMDGDWYCTGDAGSIDSSGRLRVVGRIGEVIVTGGEKVWPAAVETVLATADGVTEVAVCGVPDPVWGSIVCALLVCSRPLTLHELREHVKISMPAYCAPHRLLIVPTIPRTSSGKIQRSALPSLVTQATT